MLIDLTHMEFEILSDSRKPNFRTKKWEFKYFDDHPVPENIPYKIWVMKDKVEIYIRMRRSPPEFGFGFLLPSQVDAEVYADILLKTHPINNASLRNQYMLMAGGYDIREIYLKPHKIVLTKQ